MKQREIKNQYKPYNKRYLVMAAVVIFILIYSTVIQSFLVPQKAREIIENKIHIRMPRSSKIKYFNNDLNSGSFEAKVKIPNNSIDGVLNQLDTCFGGRIEKESFLTANESEGVLYCVDLSVQNAEIIYEKMDSNAINNHIASNYKVYCFISKNEEGQYYLYVSYK